MSKDTYWKAKQRQLLKLLGGERDGHLGEECADGVNAWLVWELKCRSKSLPQWLLAGLKQAEDSNWRRLQAGEAPRLSIEIAHQKHQPWQKDIVSMTLGQFVEWFGDGGEPPTR